MNENVELMLALHDRPGVYAERNPKLLPGDSVKVGFKVPDAKALKLPGGEWMWVVLEEIDGSWPNCTYSGRLNNYPVLIEPEDLDFGDRVEFGPGHIYDVRRFGLDFGDRVESGPGRVQCICKGCMEKMHGDDSLVV